MGTFNTRKHKDEKIVRAINECISKHKKISFHYYDLDENKQKRLRKNRKRYIENPAALVYNDDNYYLVCYSDKYQDKVIYRVDRMYLIAKVEEEVSAEIEMIKAELPTYTKQAFRMFGGKTEEVTLQFNRSILGQIYDQFGEETNIRAISNDVLETTVHVQISPTFWGWLYQFENIKITSPNYLRQEMKQRLQLVEKQL